MAIVQAENVCFGYPFASQEDLMMGNEFYFQEPESHQLLNFSDNLGSSSSSISCNASLPTEFLQWFSSDFEKQKLEIDGLLQLEGQNLRRLIQEAQMHQQALLAQNFESKINTLMWQRDQELAVARNRTMELQQLLKHLETECKSWERKAIEKEAAVYDLNNKLNQCKQKLSVSSNDTVSFCDSSSVKQNWSGNEIITCKLCQTRESCVLMFPCRHLCCCKICDGLLGHCLVCDTAKEASMEVFLV